MRSVKLSSAKFTVTAPPASASVRRSGIRSMATICLAPSRTRKTLYISGPFSSRALVAPSQFPESIAALLTKSPLGHLCPHPLRPHGLAARTVRPAGEAMVPLSAQPQKIEQLASAWLFSRLSQGLLQLLFLFVPARGFRFRSPVQRLSLILDRRHCF